MQVMTDRSCYNYRIARSMLFKDAWSMAVDGSENSKYGLPYLHVIDKSTAEGYKMQTRLYGVIVHGVMAAAYTFPTYMKGGSNVTIECIHR
jgi:hypothetical protein